MRGVITNWSVNGRPEGICVREQGSRRILVRYDGFMMRFGAAAQRFCEDLEAGGARGERALRWAQAQAGPVRDRTLAWKPQAG